jgi:hypothetical protein
MHLSGAATASASLAALSLSPEGTGDPTRSALGVEP